MKSIEELQERLQGADPPTPDDVSILWDGTRLDSKEKVLAFCEQLAAERAAAARAGAPVE